MTMSVMKKVSLPNGETIAFREREGGEEPILLVHGNMTSSKHWDLVLENMSSRYKIYAIDLRGFGASTYITSITSIKDFSDDVKEFVDAIGLKQFAMVGWSLGGAVSQQFCVDYPEYCNRLLLLASGSTRGYPFFATGEDGLPDTSNRLQTLEEVKEDKGKTLAVQTAYDAGDRDFLKTMWNMLIYRNRQPEPKRYEEYVDDMMTQRNLAEVYQALNIFNISPYHNGLTQGTDQAKEIRIPVLVLSGDQDLVITKNMTDEIIEDIGGNVTFKTLHGNGHSPLVDDIEGLVNSMEKFLEEKEYETDETTR
ncbi:alpha/beta fold hydrolase [Pontibacillus yanchengensis]|uniref:Alpha/beta fold hydrolase n=1 Tax=Pontibacillus yanchengensis TaxID=462910 RepID=A0ACC7VKR5_9BACI|nr:alpha/beta hydrolase [Pontibacillus yanchengensis]MYL55230.1 alpha/beta fold hydrolase [Pontibacillus yanchengensis]